MKLESVVFKTKEAACHLASAGLALDAINNAYTGNYEFAAAEGILAAYLQISRYLDARKRDLFAEISDRIYSKYIPILKEMSIQINSSLRDSLEKLDTLIEENYS